jgi:hypothetical protein
LGRKENIIEIEETLEKREFSTLKMLVGNVLDFFLYFSNKLKIKLNLYFLNLIKANQYE